VKNVQGDIMYSNTIFDVMSDYCSNNQHCVHQAPCTMCMYHHCIHDV